MTLIAIMNENGNIDHIDGSSISGGTFSIISTPSSKTGFYKGTLQYTFSGGSAEGFDDESIATLSPQSINPTAIYVKAENESIIRLGDSGTMVAQGTVEGTPTSITGPVEVSEAGQDKAKAQ